MKQALLFIVLFPLFAAGQAPKAPPKMHDVFLNFLEKKMPLSQAERKEMRPLVIRYFGEMRKVNKTISDPLLREQERATIKLKYRKLYAPVIGEQKATRFFAEEVQFKKKIKEVLRKRNVKEN